MKVAVIAFNGISPFHLSVPCLVFGKDRRVGDSPWFELVVCAGEEGALVTNAGFAIHCDHGLDQVAGADIVIIPSWRDVTERPPSALLETLQAAHERGALVVGLCLGAFVLAHAGLLCDKRATTHWAWAAHLARDFPRIEVDPKVLYVEAQQILTSAGVAAGLDCCIHIVRRIYGRGLPTRWRVNCWFPPSRRRPGPVHQPACSSRRKRPASRPVAGLASGKPGTTVVNRSSGDEAGDESTQFHPALQATDRLDVWKVAHE
ncbi:AraC family transcriptional regulator [Pseudomonas sp. CBR-F]